MQAGLDGLAFCCREQRIAKLSSRLDGLAFRRRELSRELTSPKSSSLRDISHKANKKGP